MSFKWYGDKVTGKVNQRLVDNLYKAAIMVETDAKRLCPVDTGLLRSSITHEVNDKALVAKVGCPDYNPETGKKFYAIYVEYGTYKMAAQPFLRPAKASNMQAIKQLFGAR